MKVNLHTHTFRCGHAKGTEKEYIERAISGGITHMGFSDHIPLVFPNGSQSNFRVPMSMAKDYIDTLRALREEYSDRIKIYIGFEMEYYPLFFGDMLQTAIELGAEYLILGQHFSQNEYPDRIPSATPTTSEELLEEYVSSVVSAIKSGVFTYVAHPDLSNFYGAADIYEKHMRKICESAALYDIPLEINFCGLRSGRRYPRQDFWKIAGECGCKAVFGFDAHAVRDAYDDRSLKVAQWIADTYKLEIITYPSLIDPKTKIKTDLKQSSNGETNE